MTYQYRIYTFHNGLGETVFRAKPIHRFIPQCFIKWIHVQYGSLRRSEYSNRDWAVTAIETHATKRAHKAYPNQSKRFSLVISDAS